MHLNIIMKKAGIKVSWRLLWYCVLVWLLTFLLGSFVVLPWYYLILPLVILLITVYFFDKTDQVRLILSKKVKKNNDRIFALGLAVSIFWFIVLLVLSLLSIANFYYFDFNFYFSDPRNWMLYPLVLLIPVVYSLILEDSIFRKSRKKHSRRHQVI